MLFRFAAITLTLAALVTACSVATTPTQSGSPAPATISPTLPDDADAAVSEPGPAGPGLTAFTEAEVQKLFDARCVQCHDSRSATLDLSSFAKNTVGVRTGATSKTLCSRTGVIAIRIQPGDRAASLLWHKVKGTQDCGDQMPFGKGSKPLDATQLERLGLYIDTLPQ